MTADHKNILASMNADIYQRFRRAIETGKWPNGQKLSDEQKATCMEAIIVYEHAHVEDSARTGFMPPKSACASHDDEDEKPLNWQ